MTIQQCYEQFGGDFEGVKSRLMTEDRVTKFARLFLADDTYDGLEKAVQALDVEAAFRGAHTLKGVAANLGLTGLQKTSSELTEALRTRNWPENLEELMTAVTAEYNKTRDAIVAFQEA